MSTLSRTSHFPDGKYQGSDILVEDAIKGNYQYMADAVSNGLFVLDRYTIALLEGIGNHMTIGDDYLMAFKDAAGARRKCLEWLDAQGFSLEDRELNIRVDDESRYI